MNQSYRPREMMGRVLTALGFAVAFAMVTLFIYPRYGLAFSLFVMFVLTIMLVRAFSRGYQYRCLNCGNQFKAPMLVALPDLLGHGPQPRRHLEHLEVADLPELRQAHAGGRRQGAARPGRRDHALRVAPRVPTR